MNALPHLSTRLLVVITEKHKCDAVMAEARNAGADGGTIMLGKGTAENKWLRMLGLDDVEKELLWSVMPAKLTRSVMDALRRAPGLSSTRGVMFTIDLVSALHLAGKPLFSASSSQEESMSASVPASSPYELIAVIVNNGGADLVMDAARQAGATGGTVVNARGTARPEDTPFFGITIVPEKELVLILCPGKETEGIMKRILEEFSHAEQGTGIVFHMPVSSFDTLGSKK